MMRGSEWCVVAKSPSPETRLPGFVSWALLILHPCSDLFPVPHLSHLLSKDNNCTYFKGFLWGFNVCENTQTYMCIHSKYLSLDICCYFALIPLKWTCLNLDCYYLFIFGDTGIWTQGYKLARQAGYCLSHTPSLQTVINRALLSGFISVFLPLCLHSYITVLLH
jgi:hypothetical protein